MRLFTYSDRYRNFIIGLLSKVVRAESDIYL